MKFFLLLLVAVMILPQSVYASNRQVTVNIPEFSVTLQHLEENHSDFLRWPFLVYNDITYFPMTYTNANLLNLNAIWTEEGLIVERNDPKTPVSIRSYSEPGWFMEISNRRTQTATTVSSRIMVNGEAIDNQNEPFPILIFRDVIYFPLTWRFAVDEFGWSYSFDGVYGLKIVANNHFFAHNGDAIGSGQTIYIHNGLRIVLHAGANRLGPIPNNLKIISAGVEMRPNGYFGYFQGFGPHFTVRDNYVHTTFYTHPDARNPQPVRISINTGMIYYMH